MKAIVYRKFGSPDQLSWAEVETPAPGEGEILVRVAAASVNPLDWHMLRGTPLLMRVSSDLRKHRPMRAGRDVAGVVEKIGSDVTRFRPGDRVFGASQGAFAESLRGREGEFVAMPPGLSFEDAAVIPIAGLTALQALRRDGRVREGERVLILGAAGGVGTFAVQLAHMFGAEVTAVCRSDAADLVRELGADHVIDYTAEDVTAGNRSYDLILDLAGAHSYRRLRRILSPDGRIVAVGGGGADGRRLGRWIAKAALAALASRLRRQKVVFSVSTLSAADLSELGTLAAEGRLRPVIERSYRLEDAADAVRRIADGHARGKVLICVAA